MKRFIEMRIMVSTIWVTLLNQRLPRRGKLPLALCWLIAARKGGTRIIFLEALDPSHVTGTLHLTEQRANGIVFIERNVSRNKLLIMVYQGFFPIVI